jgi:hypothetical protein
MEFFEDDLDSDRIYHLGTERKLIDKIETELTDLKIGKENTKSTIYSSASR